MARLLQGALYAGQPLEACQFCKYQCFKEEQHKYVWFYHDVAYKLTEATGVELRGIGVDLEGVGLPYKRLLKNSNHDIKKILRDYFKECIAVE